MCMNINFPLVRDIEKDFRLCKGSTDKVASIVNHLERVTSAAAFTPLVVQSLLYRFKKHVQILNLISFSSLSLILY